MAGAAPAAAPSAAAVEDEVAGQTLYQVCAELLIVALELESDHRISFLSKISLHNEM